MQAEAVHRYPPRKYQWYVVTSLMIGYLFAFLDRTIIGLMVQPIQSDLQISDTQMSLLMGLAFTLLYSIVSVPMGYLADRINRVRLIKFGAVIWCIMTAACGFSTTYVQLFAARVMVGLGEATLLPSANSLISDYFEPERAAKAISIFNLGLAGGAGLALVLGGQLISSITDAGGVGIPWIDDFKPWQIVFILLGISGLIFVVLMQGVKEPPRTGRLSTDKLWTLAKTAGYFRENFKLYGLLCLSLTLLTLLSFAVLGWVPTYFIRVHGWTASEAGFSYGIASIIASIAGMLTSGWWIDRRRARGEVDAAWKVMMTGLLVFIPGYIVATLFDNTWITLALLMCGVFGGSLAAIAAPTVLLTASPNEARGMSIALTYLVVNLVGAAFGPTAVALLNDYVFQDGDAIGLSISIVCLVGYIGAGAAAYFGLPHYRARMQAIAA